MTKMKTKKTYLIEGETGRYSDHLTWTVCCFESRSKAKKLVEKLNALVKKYYPRPDKKQPYLQSDRPNEILAIDPHFWLESNGTIYTVEEVSAGNDLAGF
mgnify:CR=1 FL=1